MFPLQNGSWRATAQIKDQFDRPRPKSIQRPTEAEARRAMKAFLKSYIPHAPVPKASVSSICAIYIKQCEGKERATKTLKRYKYEKEHIDSTIGHKLAATLTAADVEFCLAEKTGQAAKVSCRAFLRAVYNRVAIKNGLCVVNPAALADTPEYRPAIDAVLTFPNFQKIVAAEEDPLRLAFWLFLSETGARPGEARRLQWIELHKKEDGWWQQLLQSKTPEGKRPVPISSLCMEYIKVTDGLYVFPNPLTGKPYNERTWREYWETVQVKAEVPHVRLYALRHFFGSTKARSVRDDILKRLMRHRDIRTTKTYYVHVDDAELRSAVDPQEK